MLAKPEYSSPPDEVCCWAGRRGRAAGRGAVAELLAVSAMAKRMAAPWRIAIGKLLLARALQRSSIGKQSLPERRATAGKENHCRKGEPLPERRATARKVR